MAGKAAVTVALCAAAFCGAAQGQGVETQRQQFAGTWKLDVGRSMLGATHPGKSYAFTKVLRWDGTSLKEEDHEVDFPIAGMVIPARDASEVLTPDGSERTVEQAAAFPGLPPSRLQVTAAWQGDNLVVDESGQGFVGAMRSERRYFLSADGGELVVMSRGSSTLGDTEKRLVFVRAAGQ